MNLWLVFFSSFILALVLTYFSVGFLIRHSILDIPKSRSNHYRIVPRGGGIAIVLTFVMLISMYYFKYGTPIYLYLLLATLTVATISFIDDIKGLSIIARVPFHIAAVFLLTNLFPPDLHTALFILLAIGLFIFMNFYNFMDGIDGSITAGTIHISMSVFFVTLIDSGNSIPQEIQLVSLILMGTCSAFLIFNWPPAKVFLGDVGSITLGLICGWLMVSLFLAEHYFAAFIIPLYYMTDSTITILKRLFQGKKIWSPHSEHFFQRAVRKGHSHAKVTKKIVFTNLLLCGLSSLSIYFKLTSLLLSIATVFGLLYNLQKGTTVRATKK